MNLLLLVIILTACQSGKANLFIEQERTVREAQLGVKGVASDIKYSRDGKSRDVNTIVVDFEISHISAYSGHA